MARRDKPTEQPQVAEYRVIADGINWPDPAAQAPEDPTHAPRDKRAERGDMVRDLPPEVAKAFLEAGHIEALVDAPAPAELPPTTAPEEVKE